jgi:hypothetical protein
MKTMLRLTLWIGVSGLSFVAQAEDIVPLPGWTREQVIQALGEPPALIRSEEIEVLHYDRGPVNLRSNRVVSAALVSSEEAIRLRKERERRAVLDAQARVKRKQQLIEEGTIERERLLASPQTFSMPPEQQVQLWEDFARHYPDVRVTDLLLAARGQALEQSEKDEIRRRLAEVEYRARDAQLRAEDAEEEARRNRFYGGYYPYWQSPHRVIINGSNCYPNRPVVRPRTGIGVEVGGESGGSIMTIRKDRY